MKGKEMKVHLEEKTLTDFHFFPDDWSGDENYSFTQEPDNHLLSFIRAVFGSWKKRKRTMAQLPRQDYFLFFFSSSKKKKEKEV